MSKFLQYLKEYNYKYFASDKVNLDDYSIEEYEDEGEAFDKSKVFESDKVAGIKQINFCRYPKDIPSVFKYFLDGSRKIYKLGSMIVENRYTPIIAGQVGAVCCYRNDGKNIKKYKVLKDNILLLSDKMNNIDYSEIKQKVESMEIKGIKISLDKVNYEKREMDKPEDIAIAKVNSLMQEKEIELITEMTNSNALSIDKMLIIDGSLKFLKREINEEIFRNVIGVAKSFDVNKTGILKDNQDIGSYLIKLKKGERTQVFKFQQKNLTIGAWYLRIRDENYMKNRLDGIIKVEKVALKSEEEHIDGLDSELVDNISYFLLREGNVTSYGKEERWHKHIYSMYLAEKYLKNSFISDSYFTNVF